MRKKVVAGNWKMNNDLEESSALLKELVSNKDHGDEVDVIVFPTFPSLHLAKEILKNSSIELGAQNCHQEHTGAYTGEVSADMLKSAGCKYVLVGHSERREYFKEDSEMLAAKVRAVIESNLTPVFCFGERIEDRNQEKHFEVVEEQIKSSLFQLSSKNFSKLILAYEPVWAIGTGETASSGQIQEMHAHIRKFVKEKYGEEIAEKVRILYGGSCKPGNATDIFSNKDVDGGLIGGASLKVEDFQAIIQAAR